MRGLLAVILGAALLWLVISKLGPVEAGNSEDGAEETAVVQDPGAFMSRPSEATPETGSVPSADDLAAQNTSEPVRDVEPETTPQELESTDSTAAPIEEQAATMGD